MYERYKILIKNAPESVTNINSKFNVIKGNENNNKKCPYCDSNKIIKFGFYKGIQRYKCNNDECGRTFSGDSNNPFRCSKKFKDNWEEYFNLITQGLSLRECAKKMNITIVTSFFWRHRFLNDLKERNYIAKIGSYVELTKMVTLENFKGDRKYHGEKRDKIIVINALNNYNDVLPIIAGRSFFGFYEIRDNLIPRLDKHAYVVGYTDSRLKLFSKAFNEINKRKLDNENISRMDIMYSIKVKKWLSKFKGVASKYLDHYLSWRVFEYKNNSEDRKDSFFIKTSNIDINIKAEINTYSSWNNIKAKVISV